MRVVSWNVRSLRDDAAGVADALRALGPDLVLVQEAPRLWRPAAANRRLARRAGLVVVTGGRSARGNLLLRAPDQAVASSYDVRLPRRPGLHRRGGVGAVVLLDGRPLAVLGTHLDLDAAAREDSARALRATVPAGLPLVVGADVNEDPGGRAWQVLGEGLVDPGRAPTFPASAPARRIDALLVDARLAVLAFAVVDTGAVSDHRPLVADLAWSSSPA